MTRGAELRTPEAILEGNLEWIRALARSLARDADRAEDLAQDACVAALECPAGVIEKPRPWLAAVVRNLWRERGRSEERRRAREDDSARSGPARDELVEQVLAFREVAASVLELEEPYRAAVLMRFWEGLPPRAIAARLGTTPATVQNRITRGLALLRERLDRSRGGRAHWLAALVPWVDPPAARAALSLGGIVVNAKIVVAAVSIVLVAGALMVWKGRDAEGAAPETRVAAAEAPPIGKNVAGVAGEPALGPPDVLPVRESVPGPRAAATETAAPSAKATRTVRGRVLDVLGVPLAGIALGAGSGGAVLATSVADGRFEIETGDDSLRLASVDPAWTTVRAAAWRPDTRSEPLVVVARSLDAEGRVEDASGQGLAGARIRFALPPGFDARFDRPLEGTIPVGWSSVSGADGSFSIRGLPVIAGSRLSAVLEGYSRGEIAAPGGPADPALIVLRPPEKPVAGHVSGRVLDDRGNPVPGARVFLGLASVTSDDRGEFGIDVARAVSTDRIVAVKSGWRPAILERTREPRGEDTGWPSTIEIVLPGPALAIRGRVVDGDGKAVPGLRVSIANPTSIGAIGQMPAHAEFLAAGGAIPSMALETESSMPARDGDRFNDFYSRVGPATAFFHFVTTDAEGEFELGGLDDRRYRLSLQEPKTCTYARTDELRAGGSRERIVWHAPPSWSTVRGTLVDDEGHPVAGALVRLGREAFGVRSRVFGGRVYVTMRDPREQATTDAEGRFEFHDVPAEGMGLDVTGEGVVPAEFLLEKCGAPDAVKLAVEKRCSFEVVVSPPLEADGISILDGNGKGMDILVMDSVSTNAYTSVPITDGRSGVVSASSGARVLQLLKDGLVVQSQALHLRSGEVNRIEM